MPHQFISGDRDDMAAADETKPVENACDPQRHRGLAGAGIAGERHMQRRRSIVKFMRLRIRSINSSDAISRMRVLTGFSPISSRLSWVRISSMPTASSSSRRLIRSVIDEAPKSICEPPFEKKTPSPPLWRRSSTPAGVDEGAPPAGRRNERTSRNDRLPGDRPHRTSWCSGCCARSSRAVRGGSRVRPLAG